MEIIICTKVKKTDNDYMDAISEYIKRTSPYCRIKIKNNVNYSKNVFREGIHTMYYGIIPGTETISSLKLSELISNLNLNGFSSIVFFICEQITDYEALFESCTKYGDTGRLGKLCLSSFSLDADIAMTALTEQIYRAYTILNNITYHK